MCDTDTLGNGGSVDLEANFEPNKINVKFNGNGDDNNMNESVTCEYDGTLTLPTPPTRRGYTFAGWKLLKSFAPTPTEPTNHGCEYGELCGIPNFDTATPGNVGYGYNWDEVNRSKCHKYANVYDFDAYSCGETPDLAGPGEWKAEFDYGTIYGEASCNTTPGTKGVTTSKSHTKNTSRASIDEKYCWCRVTGFTKNGETNRFNIASSAWVFVFANGTDGCPGTCANDCGFGVSSDSDLRGAMFNAVGE